MFVPPIVLQSPEIAILFFEKFGKLWELLSIQDHETINIINDTKGINHWELDDEITTSGCGLGAGNGYGDGYSDLSDNECWYDNNSGDGIGFINGSGIGYGIEYEIIDTIIYCL